MNNQKQCYFCKSGTKYMPITNKKGEIISLHSICQNPKCSVNLTMLALKKRTSSLRSKRISKTSKPKSRLLKGTLVTLVSAALSYSACIGLANADFTSNTVTYQQTEQSISTSILPVATTTQKQDAKNILKTKKEIREYVLAQASSTGVWVAKIDHMVEHESHYDPKAIGDMQLICQYGKNKGKPVRARGIWQITDCGHPEITDEQAFDVKWSTAWALSVISKSQKDCRIQWTTCDGWYKI